MRPSTQRRCAAIRPLLGVAVLRLSSKTRSYNRPDLLWRLCLLLSGHCTYRRDRSASTWKPVTPIFRLLPARVRFFTGWMKSRSRAAICRQLRASEHVHGLVGVLAASDRAAATRQLEDVEAPGLICGKDLMLGDKSVNCYSFLCTRAELMNGVPVATGPAPSARRLTERDSAQTRPY